MDDNDFGVPAGWYPDPLGLPQLRWWDAQAWTEHTSEARAPIVLQPSARLGTEDLPERTQYRDEELPSRRQQRERERRESGAVGWDGTLDTEVVQGAEARQGELSAQPLLEMTLRELEPPLTDTLDEETPGPRRATAHANAAPVESVFSALAEEQAEAPARAIKKTRTYTAAVWIIALMPVLQVVAVIVVITALGLGNNLPLIVTIVVAPYLLVIGFAFYDRLLLQVWGHTRPASPWWALIAPAYLLARAVRTFKETGKGFGPLGVFGASVTAALAGVIIVPGILIALFPAAFAGEVQASVAADASALGADLTLSCPAPPLLIGDVFTCVATKPNGDSDSISVRLQRQNGWIAWRVEDWGSWVVAD